ncbi:MAG TPA: hypothetical protein VJX23_08395 [Candidatus Binataceae bacterium]|nr:hypothetical protein [Candidatus Binataceae bacterium]
MKKLVIAGLGLVLCAGLAGVLVAADKPADKSVSGTLEDSFCYSSMGAKGPGHKVCAVECTKKGAPISLVENGTNKIYVLLPASNNQPFSDDLFAKMEDQVTVTGKEYSKGGVNFLTTESVK